MKKKYKYWIIPALLGGALLIAGLSQEALSKASLPGRGAEPQSAVILAMDTVMEVSVYGGGDELLKKVENRILGLEDLLSTTNENSEIYRLNQSGRGQVSEDTRRLLAEALKLCEKTQGALDLSIYPVVQAWGFTTGEYRVPEKDDLPPLLAAVDYRKIRLEGSTAALAPAMKIDMGGVAKGYAGDEMAALLKNAGVTSALLNLGGNVQAIGEKPDGSPWRVAVQSPQGEGPIAVVTVEDQAVVTSGGYQRYFQDSQGRRYWHIIDPATGFPADSGLVSATIIGDSGLYADALSTALFVMGLEKAADFWRDNRDFEAILITKDQQVYITPGLKGRFSFTDEYKGRAPAIIKE